jgi:hypothetical protein
MANYVNRSLLTAVAATDSEIDEYTPANGQNFMIYKMGGHAAHNSEVKVEIRWGSTILFVTHGDAHDDFEYEFTGDGSTKLTINLVNDSSSTETIGGHYRMVEL